MIKKVKKTLKKIFNVINKDYKIMIFFIISNFFNSLVLRLIKTGDLGFRAIFFDIAFILIAVSISLLFNKKGRKIFLIFMTVFMVTCCIANSIYYNYYNSYASVSLLATSVFIKDVSDSMVEFALKWSDWIYLWEIIFIIKLIKDNKCNYKKNSIGSGIVIVIAGLFVGIGSILPPYYAYGRLYNLWNRVSVVNTFGVYVYQVDDIIQSIMPKFNNIFGYDNALLETKKYYEENTKVASKNEYTGIFEGKNVIAIHAESLQNFNLGLTFEGEEVTPNINKLAKTGMYFSNFYAQEGVGTSSDSEFTYATSLLPAQNGTVFVNYYNDTFTTIQNLMNDKGYYVFSMHGNEGDFWNRNEMHLNMGYDKFYSRNSFVIDETFGLGLSDESFFDQAVDMIKEIDSMGTPYYGTLITLTNHTPWTWADDVSDLKVTKTVEIDGEMVTRDYLEGTAIGRYIKCVNYMDYTIGKFIDELDNQGLLDNTVIVIYGDHDARLGKDHYEYMYNYDAVNDRVLTSDDEGYVEVTDYVYDLNKKVPFIIWTKDMEEEEISTPMGMIDVMPTLGNMLGIYNKYALGQDIMSVSKEDGIVVFRDGSFITDKIYYLAKNDETYAISSGVIDQDYIKMKSEYANKLIEISNYIITYDLLKNLE